MRISYVDEDDDVKWLRARVAFLDETIRQTLVYQKPTSHAVVTLKTMRDRYERIANRLAPTVVLSTWPAP